MGLVWMAMIGLGAMALLAASRIARPLWPLLGAALMLGAAGYALQGSPMQHGRPASPSVTKGTDDAGLLELRDAMFGRYTLDAAYLMAADAMTRSGDGEMAVRALLGGLDRIPRSVALWTALGTAMAAHDGNTVSPPARFAFEQAMRIAPTHPAPPFFLGLAHVRADEYAAARPYWARAAALSPERASYRRDIALRLALLDRLLADRARRPG
ncbi:tetratricopeptide repeat protein [uncultured Sphingomonas sp.]|uniref:tetratricopeptide repeat protein n=1 Tax=uncultured Sphingomonas sp. TaxID=158754 RepID=UPI0035C9F47F